MEPTIKEWIETTGEALKHRKEWIKTESKGKSNNAKTKAVLYAIKETVVNFRMRYLIPWQTIHLYTYDWCDYYTDGLSN